jgi:hypothetical protein
MVRSMRNMLSLAGLGILYCVSIFCIAEYLSSTLPLCAAANGRSDKTVNRNPILHGRLTTCFQLEKHETRRFEK